MSNILIIKHGSLGDIVQISGVLQDIREANKDKKIFILTTNPYVELLSRCPYIDAVLLDERLPRWNLFYLFKIKKKLEKFKFSQIYDLQNSARTSFYRKFLLSKTSWSSSETMLLEGEKKNDFEKESVLERFKIQLKRFNIETKHCLNPNFDWACVNIDKVVNKYFGKKFILLFPFCSIKLARKKWPHYEKLINIIKEKNYNFEIAIAPGPNEIDEARGINAYTIMNNESILNIMELSGLIKKSSYIIANDTGPAHIAAHLRKSGVVLFGHHTTPKKVSIETDMFKAITVENLNELSAETVFSKIESKLELIN